MLVSSRLSTLLGTLTTMAVVVGLLGATAPAAQAASEATWTGADSGSWSDPDNWDGAVPSPGTDLVFPAGVTRKTVVNDLAPSTDFGSITIAGSGYDVSGNDVALSDGLTATYGAGASVIRVGLGLGNGDVEVAEGGALSLRGAVTGSSGLASSGGGTLMLDAANTYTGTTTVGPGVLEVNGAVAGPLAMAGGTLAGSGTLNGTGITASAPSTVAPGPQGGSGILTYASSSGLTLPAGTTLRVDLDGPTVGTGYDQLRLTSGSALFNPNGATLAIDLGYVPTVNTSFQIVSQTGATPITGRFSGISQFGSVKAGPVTFTVGYFNSGIILTVTAVDIARWDGGGSTSNWSDPANWVGDVAPAPGSPLVFPAGVAQRAAANDFAAGTSFASITVADSGYTLSGNQVDVSGDLRAEYGGGTSSISAPVKIAPGAVSVQSGGTLTLAGAVSGTSGLTKTGAGRLLLEAANTYTGVTSVNAGTLAIAHSVALGNWGAPHGTVVLSGASLEARGTINTPEPITLSGTGEGGVGALYNGQGNNVVQSVTLTGDASFGAAAATFMLISSTLAEGGTPSRLTKTGPGTLDVLATATHAGGTTVAAGNLAVEGTLPGTTTVQSGATLSGAGGKLGSVTSTGGTVTAGFQSSPYTATAQSLTLGAASTFLTQLNGSAAGNATTGHSRLDVLQDVSLGGATLSPTMNGGYTPTPGDVLTILTADVLTGTFKDLPEGAHLTVPGGSGPTFRISYQGGDGNDITLTSVESSSTTLASSPNPSSGQAVTLTATVTPTTATGTVTFRNGAVTLGTSTVSNGSATFTTSALALGTHTITATYNGSETVVPSTSSALTQNVVLPPDTTIASGPVADSTGNPTTATFTFGSPDVDVTSYECSLDGGVFTTCMSPVAYSALAGGSHTFSVRARGAGGADPTPATRTWTVTGTLGVTGEVTVDGTAKVGQTLTATSTVTTTPASTSTSGQWFRGSDAISGATDPTYTLTNDDTSYRMTYRETHARGSYTPAAVESVPTPVVTGGVIDLGVPTITGSSVVDGLLTAWPGTVSPGSAAVSLSWHVDGAPTGVVGLTYRIRPADLGKQVTVVATATQSHHDTVTATSRTALVTPATFTTGPTATISGVAKVGETLTAGEGSPAPTPDSYTYHWLADGTPITGATGRTLTLEAAHVDTRIGIRVTAVRTGYADATTTSERSTAVAPASFSTDPTATISGVLKVGETLTAGEGSPIPTPDAYAYRWFADGTPITGATGRTFTLQAAHVDTRITVRVTATRAGYAGATTTSDASAVVATHLAPDLSLTGSSTRVRLGEQATLTWFSRRAAGITASGAWSGTRSGSGTETVTPTRTGTHTYTLSATNGSGTTVAQVAVEVALPASTLTLKTPGTVRAGRTITVRTRGLAPREAYTVRIGGVKVASGRATASGQVKRSLRVPSSTKAGKRVVRVTGSLSDRTGIRRVKVVRTTAHTVTLRASSVRASDDQRITVRSLRAGEKVSVVYQGARISPKDARANARGVYVLTFDVGMSWGRKTVTVKRAQSARTTSKTFSVVTRCPQGGNRCR